MSPGLCLGTLSAVRPKDRDIPSPGLAGEAAVAALWCSSEAGAGSGRWEPARQGKKRHSYMKCVPLGAAACSKSSLFSARCSSWPLAAPASFPEVKPDNLAISSAVLTVPLPQPGDLHHPGLSVWKDPSPEGSTSGWTHTQSSPGGLILGRMRREMGHRPRSQHHADLPGFEIHQIPGL